MKKEKFYFKSEDDTFCQSLQYFSKEELEELDYNLIEAIPDNNTSEYIWCTHRGETVEKFNCKKSICTYYSSKSGRGKCQSKGSLYWHGDLVNVKEDYGIV